VRLIGNPQSPALRRQAAARTMPKLSQVQPSSLPGGDLRQAVETTLAGFVGPSIEPANVRSCQRQDMVTRVELFPRPGNGDIQRCH